MMRISSIIQFKFLNSALYIIFAVAFFAPVWANANEFSFFIKQEYKADLDFVFSQYTPPNITDVSIDPENPLPDEDVIVTVTFEESVDDDKLFDVMVYFTVDYGMTWDYVDLEEEEENVWIGEISGQESGKEVYFGVRAVNESGNMMTELICETESDIFVKEDAIQTLCSDDSGDNYCEGPLPSNCLFALTSEDDDYATEDRSIPSYFDVVTSRIGFDKNNVYLYYNLRSGIPNSILADPDASPFYATNILTKEYDKRITNAEAFLNSGGLLAYIPVANIPCSFDYLNNGQVAHNTEHIECHLTGNHLVISFHRKLIGENALQFDVIGFNMFIAYPNAAREYDYTRTQTVRSEYGEFHVSVYDKEDLGELHELSMFTRVSIVSRSYQVQ